MFKAMVLACSLVNPTDCWEFVDTRGPYASPEICKTRAYEMSGQILAMHGHQMKPIKFKCEKLKGQML